jgi:hypothetical protein
MKLKKIAPKKRGRPAGVKNKPKALEKQIAHWDAEPRTPVVDYKALAEKLQNALAKSYVEVQGLEKEIESKSKLIKMQCIHLSIKQKRIDNLEYALCSTLYDNGFKVDEDNEDSSV